ncbi:MAG: polymer-forming cytoskeletal protein [bacterium]
MQKKSILLLCSLFLLMPFISIRAQETYKIPAEKSITATTAEKTAAPSNKNFYRAGAIIEINEPVNGDVIVMAQKLKINAPVSGDVIAIAEEIKINNDIEGDLRIAGKNVIINGKIKKNANIFSVNTEIGKTAMLEKDLLIYGQTILNNGIIKGDLNASADKKFELKNAIEGNADIKLGDTGKLIICPNSSINGNLSYTSIKEADIADGAIINGEKKHINPEDAKQKTSINWFWKLIALFSMLALGMVVIMIDKKNTMSAAGEIIKHSNKSLLFGILYIISIPAISIALLFTLIGIPISIILLAIFFILLYASQVFASIALGKILTKKYKISDINAMIIGVLVFTILVSLPWIGDAIKLLAILIGLGAIINTKRMMLKESNSVK